MASVFVLGASLLPFALRAQTAPPCVYTLNLLDAQGDGWNGANLQVRINSTSTNYTLSSGSTGQFLLTLNNNDSLTLRLLPGRADAEIGFSLVDPFNSTKFNAPAGSLPLGVVYRERVVCPTCPVTPFSQVRIDDVRAFTARLSWLATFPGLNYQIEYDTLGFRRNTGRFVRTSLGTTTLTNLKENQAYQFYLSVICKPGDTSQVLGPFNFKTRWANDVGIAQIVAPLSSCGLGSSDSVKVLIRNYGGQAQSLIPFDYAVNGTPAGVSMPSDGLYTGVVSKDSSEIAVFDATTNFATPGVYTITSWTALKSDSVITNDTLSTTITSVPTITFYPYFNNLETNFSGWLVDTASVNPSWAFGALNRRGLAQPFSGNFVWATNLNGNYNSSEKSYLLSPCFNFSNLQRDPVVSLALNLDLETCCDAAWIELSTDGGESWAKLGTGSSGINWYNDAANRVWSGHGGFNGWFTATHPLPGTATAENVRLRIVLQSDFATTKGGILVDDIAVYVPERDFVATDLRNASTNPCGVANDQVVFSIGNLSSVPVTAFTVAYRINNGPVVTENVGNFSIPVGARRSYTFRAPFSSVNPGRYDLKAWIVGENTPRNDTMLYTFYTAFPVPFAEDFEGQAIPNQWIVDSDLTVSNARGNTSFVLADNLNNNDNSLRAATPVFGPLSAMDSLSFDYRFVNFNTGILSATELGPNDRLEIQVSLDCGQTFTTLTTITRANHQATTAMRRFNVRLGQFAGRYLQVRFLATWGQGNYWVEIDNIGVVRCTGGFATLTTQSTPTGTADGSALVFVDPYRGPYTFSWSNGGQGRQLMGLRPGLYTVTVTDRFGCTDVQSARVNVRTSVNDLSPVAKLTLSPNPTTATTLLAVTLHETGPVVVQLLNAVGQVLVESSFGATQQLNIPLSLQSYPNGFYFVRILANGRQHTAKLVKM